MAVVAAATDYQIGWICALSSELAASRAMLDEEHGKLNVQVPYDHNTYFGGRIHDCNVVMACLPAGRDGAAPAAAVAKDMIRTFPKLRFCLLVGIGGGVPNLARGHDVRLGDVVVSMPTGERGGVIQYDKGKLTEDGFVRKGALDSPPTILLTAVSSLQAEHDLNGSQIPAFIAKAFERYPRLRQTGYMPPVPETDLLFEPLYGHQTDSRDCSACEKTYLVARSSRFDNEPYVHYGLIASANVVVKSSTLREHLANRDGALCVEMEAAGLMNHFPCLVIRGICDYADSHKNDHWQKYAAMTAAACAKELLGHIVISKLSEEQAVSDLLDLAREQVAISREHLAATKAQFADQSAIHQSKEFIECHQTFKTCDYVSFKNFNPDAADGTCQWVISNEKFVDWREGRSDSLLWITADPGCGKSVLSKTMVDVRLRENTQQSVCYFFFKDNDEQNTLSVALCAILHQLFASQPHLLQHALKSWKANGKNLCAEPDELWHILLKAAADSQALPIVCLFDALDECNERSQSSLIRKLCAHCGSSYALSAKRLKFLVTSRPYDNIEHTFRQGGALFHEIRIYGEDENLQLRKEIDIVVHSRVAELSAEFHLSQNAENRLRDELLNMEHRTYLWLYLAIDHIRQIFRDSMQPNLVLIERLPSSVEDAYERILDRVSHQQQPLVKRILLVVVGARRSLTIGEMALALEWSNDLADISAESVSIDHLERFIRHWCGLFVFFNSAKIQLIHQTAKEFLLHQPKETATLKHTGWNSCLVTAEVESVMTRLCVAFLCSASLEPCVPHLYSLAQGKGCRLEVAEHLHVRHGLSPRSPTPPLNPTPHSGTFFEYAATTWADHLNVGHASDRDGVWDKILRIFLDNKQRWECLYKTIAMNWIPYRQNWSCPGGTPIHLAAMLGQTWLLQMIGAAFDAPLDERDGFERTPLMWAASRGELETVEWLVSKGADVSKTNWHESVLSLAMAESHEALIEYLFDHGVDVNARDADGQQATESFLLLASRAGQHRKVALCLKAGAIVDEPAGFFGDTALQAAAADGHAEVVKTLLEAGADVNLCNELESHDAAVPEKCSTALQLAAGHGDLETVQLLLTHGAEVHAGLDDLCCNALHAAVEAAHPTVVQLLLDAGADIHAEDSCDGNAVQLAVQFAVPHEGDSMQVRREATLEVLLKNGADLHAGSGTFANALHTAAAGGSPMMIRKLLDLGLDINSEGGVYGHALQAASQNHRVENMEVLLDAGADINAQGGFWGHALLAVMSGDTSSVCEQRLEAAKFLLQRGINVDLADDEWGTALHLAAYQADRDVVELLLAHGANVDAVAGKFGTPLHASVHENTTHSKRRMNLPPKLNLLTERLIKTGVDVNADVEDLGTALHIASRSGCLHGMQLLLDHGADINARGGQYGNALQTVVMSSAKLTVQEREEMVQLLLDRQIDVVSFGPDAREKAQSRDYRGIVLLLDRFMQMASWSL